MTDRCQLKDLGFADRGVVVIGEVGQAHDGSLGTAHAYIDAIADAGADVVKFQTHIAAAESTLDEPWRVKFSHQDETRFDYWRRMEFTEPQWHELARHARDRGLVFTSSPFSVAAVELLKRAGVHVWKIASGEIYNPVLLDAVFDTGDPVLFSSGMSRLRELDPLVERARQTGVAHGCFQCTSQYPTPPDAWGLAVIDEMHSRFACPVGLSDHSGDIYAGLAAVARGAELLEVHVTFDRRSFGPDVPASLTIDRFADLVNGVRQVSRSLEASPGKDALAESTAGLKDIFGRSLALERDLAGGTVISSGDVTLKKPAGGIPWARVGDVVGRTLRRDKPANRLLTWEDFDD